MRTESHSSESRPADPESKMVWLLPVILFLSTLAVFAVTAERSVVNTDARAASVGAWRIANTGTPWLDGVDLQQLSGTHSVESRGTWLTEAPNGHVAVQRMAGPILAGVPFYWFFGNDSSARNFSIGPGGLAASAMSAVTVLLLFLTIRRWLAVQLALAGALIFAFATPTWSVSANGLWTHSVTQLGIAGAAYCLSRDRWWLGGLFLGVGMLGRPHIAVIAAILGIGLAWSRRRIQPMVSLGVMSSISLGLLALWNRTVYGDWSIGGAYGDGQVAKAIEGVGGEASGQWMNYLGFLISPDRGFLIWTPVILLLLPALARSWRDLPDWSKWLLIGGVIYTVLQLRLNYFAGGDGFHAYRHGLELLTCTTPALAHSASRLGRVGRSILFPVVAVQVAAFTIGATVEGYFVPIGSVWSDNSFWLVLRNQPAVVGTWLAICLCAGVVMSFRIAKHSWCSIENPHTDLELTEQVPS